MGKKYLTCFFIIFVLSFFIVSVKASYAASLQFDPTTVSVLAGQAFQIKVNIDTNGEKVSSTDIRVLYDAALLDVQTVTKGTFFPSVDPYITHDGKLYVAGTVDTAANSKSGTGNIAKVQFTALKNGSGTITFDCTQGASQISRTSHIIKNDSNATDIIQCANNNKVTVTVGGTTSLTPTIVTASSTTVTPTPSTLIQSGVFDNTLKFVIPGIFLVLMGIVARVILI